MIRQFELVERVKRYDPAADEDALNRAYVFSMSAHGSQTRASGDPYFSHPLEVAGILTEYKLDSASIVTALLHDTVEDTVATIDQVRDLFGEETARLVDGVTKLSQLELQSDDTKQAENFRKLFVATSQDIRVLLVKLADRLHNMRTLEHVAPAAKRLRIARETMEIYAPLAARIGMHRMKDELEDLAFKEFNAEARQSILNRLEFLREHGGDLVSRITDSLKRTLAEAGLDAWVSGREKRPYSIWRKMMRKNVEFEQLSDIMAFRVVLPTVAECYQGLGVIHTHFRCVPERFKDYISTPKPNGYQSLHTTVIGPERARIEIQIRTADMHDLADYGVAAHWRYKGDQAAATVDGRQYRWVRELLEILESASGPEEFLENTKLEMFQDQVFCFTPKGDLIALPTGATPIDFAYAVHSEVGDACVGVKINGRPVPLRTRLANGDQVEIVTAEPGTPSPIWEEFVVTGKARARIRRYVRSAQRVEFLRLGRAILDQALYDAGYETSDSVLETAREGLEVESVDDLYVSVGKGVYTAQQVIGRLIPSSAPEEEVNGKVVPLRPRATDRRAKVPIRGLVPGMAVHFANCCHPLPGDRIIGIMTAGKGVAIHTNECETLESFHETPERWIDVGWEIGGEESQRHVGRITATVANEPGTLGSLATIVGNNLGNINNLRITNRSSDFFDMVIDIEVSDTRHLTEIIAALRATPQVNSVERTGG